MLRLLFVLLILTGAVAAEELLFFEVDFERAMVGAVPQGWTVAKTGTGEGSVWKVAEDKTSPSGPKVLAQTAESPLAMFNLCVLDEQRFTDVRVSVAFKAVKGAKDQGGGVVWRYQDANNYYIARFNPLEANYRVYKVVNGVRTQLATREELKFPAGKWQTLSITMKGNAINCLLDGTKYLEAKDDTFKQPGKVGLWTKADAQTYFDNVQAGQIAK